jgi:murein DD-endopeptidase MepM/ murein hydrolase activator NlpD
VGTIAPDAKNYPTHPDAVFRTPGSTQPLVVLDFGPTKILQEPKVNWPGGEVDILGAKIAKKEYDHFHKGIDISTGLCTGNVRAAAAGRVRVSHADESEARVVVIDHGMINGHHYETRYAHMQAPPSFLIAVGEKVVAGTPLGKVGDTGNVTGCHLHFAITKDGRPVDPWRRLSQNTSIDPDAPVAAVVPTTPLEVPDVPIPKSDVDYVAGAVAVIGNLSLGANVRAAARLDAELVRTIDAGMQETWLPTCWVAGEKVFESDRWLTRWFAGHWEFTHEANVRSVLPI